MYDTIIIGAGPAGLAAAIYTCRKKMKTLIISVDVGGQGNLTKSDIKGSNELIQLEEFLDQIPENYSSPIRKRLHRLFEN